MIDTMNTFLNYYKQENNFSTFNVKENITEVLRLIDVEIKNSKIDIDISEEFPLKISANKNEWMHIWLNLITNSLKASKSNNIQKAKISITINENSIIFTDNCKGFEEEKLIEIQEEKQQGLGLKMSKKILEKNNWSIKIENSNNGATFTLYKKI